jgi:serine/threonine-protein kinase
MWHADLTNGFFTGGCLAVWDMTKTYGPDGRGLNCTSADAAGFPIAPLLFTPEEVASGEIPHAIRFILPNDRIRRRRLRGAGHPLDRGRRGAIDTPPYGAAFRLRADFPVDKLPEGPRVVRAPCRSTACSWPTAGRRPSPAAAIASAPSSGTARRPAAVRDRLWRR